MSDNRVTNFWVVLPAAGSGSRMKNATPKQYLTINNTTVIEHAVKVFLDNSEVKMLMICLQTGDRRFGDTRLAEHPKVETTLGGESRAESVLNGLLALRAHEHDWVLVHDAARPCLSNHLLERLIEQLRDDDVGGLLAVPAKDTLKQASQNQRSLATLDRSTIWQAQTPQMFRYGVLRESLIRALKQGVDITDEASAVEASGYQPKLVEGDARNLKVTTPDDLQLAEYLLTVEQSVLK